ncbi:MAG: HAD hydrolase family protein [Clostridia bacterium]|jgi:hydroxymethylpyrimidine pyrophosphatase-like HAD family hydrolase|nr:HAD hydrolase family protein [Clostridia bacterium]
MYKLVAIDLDGTLLNSNGEISNENKNSILEATKNGTMVVLSSRKNAKFRKKYCNGNWSR